MASSTDDTKNLTTVERALRLVTDVRAGEGAMALLLTLDVFLVLDAYYLIKPVREALIGAVHNGPRYKSYMGAGVATALFIAVPVYARLASAWPRNKLILRVSAFFAANLVAFYFLGLTPCPFAAGGRYYWPPPGLDERNANLLGLPPNEPTLPHRLAGNREFK